MTDDRDVSAGRDERIAPGHDAKSAGIPRVAHDRRDHVPFASGNAEKPRELRLDDEKATVGLDRLAVVGLRVLKLRDQAFTGRETTDYAIVGPIGIGARHDATDIRPRRALTSAARIADEKRVEPSRMLRAVGERYDAGPTAEPNETRKSTRMQPGPTRYAAEASRRRDRRDREARPGRASATARSRADAECEATRARSGRRETRRESAAPSRPRPGIEPARNPSALTNRRREVVDAGKLPQT